MTKGEAIGVGVFLSVVMVPSVVCVMTVLKHTPPSTEAVAPPQACTPCVCMSDEDDFAQNMAAYGEGVRSGQRGGFDAYVVDLCMGKVGCIAAFEELRARYERQSATPEGE